MSEYYHTVNASRKLAGFQFMSYSLSGGSWNGVFEAKNDSDIAVLNSLANDPKHGITKITKAQFEEALKKKESVASQDLKPMYATHRSPATLAKPVENKIAAPAAAVTTPPFGSPLPSVPTPAPRPTADVSDIKTGPVKPSNPELPKEKSDKQVVTKKKK